jgi:A/G-specific adenine glycosylase
LKNIFFLGPQSLNTANFSGMEKWFSRQIISWYGLNKRDLPWRHERDPYKIWLSEVILQQTQVIQGLSYYLKFVSAYPSVLDLAGAPEDEVLKLWQGLGYYSRARNLHAAANFIRTHHRGKFPEDYPSIRNLKGVGDYTAAAIASFAFDLAYPVIDGNVYRVLSRVFGIETPIDSTIGKKQFATLALELLNTTDPATHNQAIMEFGALCCRPLRPDCENCPVNGKCFALKNAMVSDLPVKSKKVKVKDRFFNYFILADPNNNILINKRKNKDIWKGLYEFPLIETETELSVKSLLACAETKVFCGKQASLRFVSHVYKHKLTHQNLNTRFFVVANTELKSEGIRIGLEKLDEFAFPRLIEKFLTDCKLKEIL